MLVLNLALALPVYVLLRRFVHERLETEPTREVEVVV